MAERAVKLVRHRTGVALSRRLLRKLGSGPKHTNFAARAAIDVDVYQTHSALGKRFSIAVV